MAALGGGRGCLGLQRLGRLVCTIVAECWQAYAHSDPATYSHRDACPAGRCAGGRGFDGRR